MAETNTGRYFDDSYFSSKAVGQVLLINTKNFSDRMERVERLVNRLEISGIEFIEGVDHHQLSGEQCTEILESARVSKKIQDGVRVKLLGPATNYEPILLPLGTEYPKDFEDYLMERYTSAASHINAMQKALKNWEKAPPEDKNKWIIILEDDVLLNKQDGKRINNILENAPETAGVISLGNEQGVFKIGDLSSLNAMLSVTADTGDKKFPELAKPTGSFGATAIAYRPEMLRAMLKTQEKNLAMTREDGGWQTNDRVNVVIQNYLAGFSVPPGAKHDEILRETFEEATAGLKEREFFALNPSLVRKDVTTTAVASPEYTDIYRYGERYRTFSNETAIKVYELFVSTKNPMLRAQCARILERERLEKPRFAEDKLVQELEKIHASDKSFSARLAKQNQTTDSSIGR